MVGSREVLMNVQLRPEVAEFIEGQVKSGRYGSVEEAVNETIVRARAEAELLAGEMSDEDLEAIEQGLAQADRGEMRPLEEVREEWRARLSK
jgi:putative addiction module CopG family antidote